MRVVPPARAPTRAFLTPASRHLKVPCPRPHPARGAWESALWRVGRRARCVRSIAPATGRRPVRLHVPRPSPWWLRGVEGVAYEGGRPATCVRRPLLCRTEPLRPSHRHGRVELPPAPFPVAGLPKTCSPRTQGNFPSRPIPCPGRDLDGTEGHCGLASVAAAVQPRRRPHHSELRPKSSQETSLVLLRPRPTGPGRRFAGIWPDCRRPVAEDPIASSLFFPGKDLLIWNLKLLGAGLQN
jgi:hypothetical protein